MIEVLLEKFKLKENIFEIENENSVVVGKLEEFNDKILCLLEIQPSFGFIAVRIWVGMCVLKLYADSEIIFLENLMNFDDFLYKETIREGLFRNLEYLIEKDVYLIHFKKLKIINQIFNKKIKIRDKKMFLKIEDIIFHWIEQIYKLNFEVKLEQENLTSKFNL